MSWEFFSSPPHPDRFWRSPSLLSNGYQGCEADHSSPSSAEVKDAWSYTSTPPIIFHGVGCSVKIKHKNMYNFVWIITLYYYCYYYYYYYYYYCCCCCCCCYFSRRRCLVSLLLALVIRVIWVQLV